MLLALGLAMTAACECVCKDHVRCWQPSKVSLLERDCCRGSQESRATLTSDTDMHPSDDPRRARHTNTNNKGRILFLREVGAALGGKFGVGVGARPLTVRSSKLEKLEICLSEVETMHLRVTVPQHMYASIIRSR